MPTVAMNGAKHLVLDRRKFLGIAAGRKKLLDMASTGKKKLLGHHWPYPGIGMAEAKDGAYVYVPVS